MQTFRRLAAMLVVLALALAAPPAVAAPDAQGQRMLAAFDAWVAKWGVANASFVAMREKKLVASASVGNQKADAPQGLASLSKAITGVCVAKLVEVGSLGYSARLGALIPAYFRANKPASAAAKTITVGELLTHTSGMRYDPSQGTAAFAALDWHKTNFAQQLALALAEPLSDKTYSYNNINYDALGLIIETKTGMPYETFCREAVLAPAGIRTAKLDPERRVLNAYGGWRLSARDYARFLDHFRPAAGLMRSGPANWPKVVVGTRWYSIGTLLRASQGSYNLWHDGAFRWSEPAHPERTSDFGSYFAMWLQNTRFVATFAPQPAAGALADLDLTMYRAAFPSAGTAARGTPAIPETAPATANGTDRGPATSR